MKEPMNVSKIKFYGFTPKETVFFEVHNLVNGKPSLSTSYGGYSGFNTALERMKELVKISEKSEYLAILSYEPYALIAVLYT